MAVYSRPTDWTALQSSSVPWRRGASVANNQRGPSATVAFHVFSFLQEVALLVLLLIRGPGLPAVELPGHPYVGFGPPRTPKQNGCLCVCSRPSHLSDGAAVWRPPLA